MLQATKKKHGPGCCHFWGFEIKNSRTADGPALAQLDSYLARLRANGDHSAVRGDWSRLSPANSGTVATLCGQVQYKVSQAGLIQYYWFTDDECLKRRNTRGWFTELPEEENKLDTIYHRGCFGARPWWHSSLLRSGLGLRWPQLAAPPSTRSGATAWLRQHRIALRGNWIWRRRFLSFTSRTTFGRSPWKTASLSCKARDCRAMHPPAKNGWVFYIRGGEAVCGQHRAVPYAPRPACPLFLLRPPRNRIGSFVCF